MELRSAVDPGRTLLLFLARDGMSLLHDLLDSPKTKETGLSGILQ